MFETELITHTGARKVTKVYIVAGHMAEPLLGDRDAVDLGFIHFNPRGRDPTAEEVAAREKDLNSKNLKKVTREKQQTTQKFASIPQKLRTNLGVSANTTKPQNPVVPVTEMAKINKKQGYDCVMNTVITDKTAPGEIRMNIDCIPINPGIKRTKYHVKLPQEIRHDLVGAAVFSEMDMPGVPDHLHT